VFLGEGGRRKWTRMKEEEHRIKLSYGGARRKYRGALDF